MHYYGFDPTIIYIIPALIISLWAQFKVSFTFNKYSKVYSVNALTGAMVARRLLDYEGLYNVNIELVEGKLSDHCDPKARVLRLSRDVYTSTSVAAIGVAAHEVGHAIQHKESYAPLALRTSIVPIVSISTNLSWILFLIGMIVKIKPLVTLGIILFSAIVIFNIVTLPVEFNASSRALNVLSKQGILLQDEVNGAKNVLKAAAMTYVAATITAIAQLLRLIAISNSSRD